MAPSGFGRRAVRAVADAPVDARPLAGAAALVTALAVLGVLEPWPGLVHLVALTPLGSITDVQLLLVHAPGWPTFVVGTAVSVALRSLLLAATLRRLDRTGLVQAFGYHVAVLPLVLVAAVLLHAAEAVLFYLLFWLGLAASIAAVLFTGAVPWTRATGEGAATTRPRRQDEPVGRVGRVGRVVGRLRPGTVGAYLAGLTVLGAGASIAPAAAVVAVVLSAALTLATVWVLREPALLRRTRRAVALVPAAALAALVAAMWTGPAAPPEPAGGQQRPGSVLLMSGIDSSSGSGAILEIDPRSLGWTCEDTWYYSYAGPGDGQPRRDARCEIDHGAPYTAEDTTRPRDEQVRFLERQVAGMDPPVTVITHSQGVWITWDAARQDRLPGVETIVLLGAFAENQVTYPPAGAREPGAVGRTMLGVVTEVPRPGGTTAFEPDSPLGREWLADPDAVRDVLTSPLPERIRALSVPSTFDLPLAHWDHTLDHARDACPVPAVHPDLPYSDEVHEVIGRFLDGDGLPPCAPWRSLTAPLLRHVAAPPS